MAVSLAGSLANQLAPVGRSIAQGTGVSAEGAKKVGAAGVHALDVVNGLVGCWWVEGLEWCG